MLRSDCACPRIDARDCMRFRSDRAGVHVLFDDDPPPDDDEACECYCHDTTGELYDNAP